MNYPSIVRVLSLMGALLAAAMAPPALVAAIQGEAAALSTFIVSALAIIVIVSSVVLLTPAPERSARPTDGLAVVLIFWILAPVAAAGPFLIGTAETSSIRALHEAVSCLTTTGHSVLRPGEEGWPASLLVWRGMLHLVGAVLSLTAAASVFAALNLGGPGIHRSVLFTWSERSFFAAAPRVARIATAVVLVITLAVFAGLTLAGVPGPRALGLAISVASTGLVDPSITETYTPTAAQGAVIFVGLVAATLGLYVLIEGARGRFRTAILDPESTAWTGCMVVLVAAAMLTGLSLIDSAGWAATSLATSGVPVAGAAPLEQLPTAMVILPALIGGSALSTAGGLKLARLVILTRRAGQEFSRLGYRDAVATLRFRGRAQPGSAIIGVWVYMIAYVAVVSAVIVLLSFSGADFDVAARAAAGAISNSGHLAGDFDDAFSQSVIIIAMLLGRWEVLGLLPALNPRFWRV
ncbi:MAG: potassium transporter TrkG [Pseudomonadota bacterium]